MCNLIFDTPVVMKTCNGEILHNPSGIEALLAKTVEGDDGKLVQLIRTTDGSVAIQSLRNGLYLSVEEDLCAFKSTVVDESAKFVVSLVGATFFVFESFTKDEKLGGDGAGRLSCGFAEDKEDSSVKPFEKAWMFECIPPTLNSLDTSSDKSLAAPLTPGGMMTEAFLKVRREHIVRLATEGQRSLEDIDAILTRMYGFAMPPGSIVETKDLDE